eukprot:5292399-Prymnesium_polylepis.3
MTKSWNCGGRTSGVRVTAFGEARARMKWCQLVKVTRRGQGRGQGLGAGSGEWGAHLVEGH